MNAEFLYVYNVVLIKYNEMSTEDYFKNLPSLAACVLSNGEIVTDSPVYITYPIEAWKQSKFCSHMEEEDILLIFVDDDTCWMREYQDFICYPEIYDFNTETSLITIGNEKFGFIHKFY